MPKIGPQAERVVADLPPLAIPPFLLSFRGVGSREA